MKFVKMESLGNDYIIIDNTTNDKEKLKENKSKLIKLSDRNFGIGSNGIIFIEKNTKNNYRIEIFNKDGTIAKTSGNGILCVAKYLYSKKLVEEKFNLETYGKNYEVTLNIKNKEIEEIKINMGRPSFDPRLIPVLTDKNIFINEKIRVLGKNYIVTGVSIGNPHVVVFDKNVDMLDINNIGPYFQSHYKFPDKINVVFEEIRNGKIKIRTYEKGNDETKSCGSAACAAVVAATLNNMIKKDNEMIVEQLGGNLKITYQDNEDIILKGNAKKVYKGKILIK